MGGEVSSLRGSSLAITIITSSCRLRASDRNRHVTAIQQQALSRLPQEPVSEVLPPRDECLSQYRYLDTEIQSMYVGRPVPVLSLVSYPLFNIKL